MKPARSAKQMQHFQYHQHVAVQPAVPTCVGIKVVARHRLQHVSTGRIKPEACGLCRRALRLQRRCTLLRRLLGPLGLLGLLLSSGCQWIVLLRSLLLHTLLLFLGWLPLLLRLPPLPRCLPLLSLLLPHRRSFPPLLLLPDSQRIHILLCLPCRCLCRRTFPKLFGCPPGIRQRRLGRSLRQQPRPPCSSPIVAAAVAAKAALLLLVVGISSRKAVSSVCEAQGVVGLGVQRRSLAGSQRLARILDAAGQPSMCHTAVKRQPQLAAPCTHTATDEASLRAPQDELAVHDFTCRTGGKLCRAAPLCTCPAAAARPSLQQGEGKPETTAQGEKGEEGGQAHEHSTLESCCRAGHCGGRTHCALCPTSTQLAIAKACKQKQNQKKHTHPGRGAQT
jgi:hypothetical protein